MTGPNQTIVSAPDLSLTTKTYTDLNGGLVQPGDIIEFTITVPNDGNMNATAVGVTDAIPTFGITYNAGSTELNGVPVADAGGTTPLVGGLTVNSPSGAAGVVVVGESAVVTFRMTLADDIPYGTIINNSVNVSGSPGLTESASAPAMVVSSVSHSVTVTPDLTVSTCDVIDYVLTFSTSGSEAFDSYFQMTAEPGLAYVTGSASATTTAGPTTDLSDPDVDGLVWTFNFDGVNPNPGDGAVWDVPDGETLTLTFQVVVEDCSPGTRNLTASTFFRPGELAPYVSLAPDAVTGVDVLEGAITIKKLPVAPNASIGDAVAYTITVASVGFGSAGNILLHDNVRPGLTYLPGSTTPAADSVFVQGDGSTDLFWFPRNHAGLAELDPGEVFAVALGFTLNACVDYDDMATATWGCNAEPCQEVSATSSVKLILNEPELAFSVNPGSISIPDCDPGGVTVTVTIDNTGGPAENLDLLFSGLSAQLSLANVAGSVTYIPGAPDTFRVGSVAPGSVNFTFDVIHDNECSTPSGSFFFTPTYENQCGDPYSSQPFFVSYATDPLPSLSVSKSRTVEVLEGGTASFTIDLCYGDCRPGQPGDRAGHPAGLPHRGRPHRGPGAHRHLRGYRHLGVQPRRLPRRRSLLHHHHLRRRRHRHLRVGGFQQRDRLHDHALRHGGVREQRRRRLGHRHHLSAGRGLCGRDDPCGQRRALGHGRGVYAHDPHRGAQLREPHRPHHRLRQPDLYRRRRRQARPWSDSASWTAPTGPAWRGSP